MASIFHSSSGLACTSSPTRPKELEGRGEEEKGGLSRGTEMSEDLPTPIFFNISAPTAPSPLWSE
jgi:hypothetical protein